MKRILIENAAYILCGDTVITDGFIEILGDKIAYVGNKKPEGIFDEVICARGKGIIPGLVNAHSHLAMTFLRGYAEGLPLHTWLNDKILPAEDKLDDEIVYWFGQLAICEMIKSGTTLFSDMYFFMDNIAKAAVQSKIKANLSRSMVCFDENPSKEDYRFKESVKFYDDYNMASEGRIKVDLAPHAPYTCTKKYLQMIAEKAKELNCLVTVHAAETKKEFDDFIQKYQMTPVEFLDSCGIITDKTYTAHNVFMTDHDRKIYKEKRASIVHNPTSNLKLGSGIAKIDKMLGEGINVALGTDGCASNNNLNLFEEMHLAALLQKGILYDPTLISVDDVISMATINGAVALGRSDTGIIKEDKKADLVIVNMDKPHLYPMHDFKNLILYSMQASDVESVVCDGEFLLKNNELLTLDFEKIKYNALKCLSNIKI